MATYPNTLPAPLVEGYMLAPVDQTIRTDMEAGPARVRRRTHARNDILDVSFLFAPDEMSAFRIWFEGDADGGAGWFDIALDVGDGSTTQEEARFKGAWKASRVGLHWKVTAQLEIR